MEVVVLQHVPFEGPGALGPWLEARGHRVEPVRLYAGQPLPDPARVEALLVMGGPMGVADTAAHPWLSAEKRFLESCLKGGCPVLGICLGAQLIAEACGARVYRNREPEIGWFPVRGTGDGLIPGEVEVFHWHSDTFELPAGAERLAWSEGTQNQGFRLGQSVLALQFHVESTPETVRQLVEACGAGLPPGRFTQDAATLMEAVPGRFAALHVLMERLAEAWIGGSGTSRE